MTHGPDAYDEDVDRRAYERRKVDLLEARVALCEQKIGVVEARVSMIIATVNSRFDALKKGEASLSARVEELRTYKERIIGAFGLIVLLGVTGIIGGVIAIIKAIKGP